MNKKTRISKRALNKTVWIDRSFYPFCIGFCPSKKAWKKLMKAAKIKDEPYPDSDGRVTHFKNMKGFDDMVIMTISNDLTKTYNGGVLSLIVHECVHIFQFLVEEIEENSPSIEFEAYTIQHLKK